MRNGVPSAVAPITATPDTIRAMTPDMLFDYLAVRLNPDKAAGKVFSINIDFTDLNSRYTLSVENAVLNHTQKQIDEADVGVTLSMETMNDIQLNQLTLEQAIEDGQITLEGDEQVLDNFLTMLDSFDFWFNIVTP